MGSSGRDILVREQGAWWKGDHISLFIVRLLYVDKSNRVWKLSKGAHCDYVAALAGI
jgi:hypothetical protein